MQSCGEIWVRMFDVIFESVQIFVTFATVQERAPVRPRVESFVIAHARLGAMSVLVVVFEAIRVLVGFIAATNRAPVGLVRVRCRRFANGFHHAHNLFSLPDQIFGR